MSSAEETPLHLTLTFRHRDESRDEDGPNAFWKQVQSRYRNSGFEEAPPRRLEERIIDAFGRDLRDTLINDYMLGRGKRNRHRRFPGEEFLIDYELSREASAPSFAFQVTGINYGSLSLGLDVVGAKGLIEFFNNNFALFQTVLSQYAPIAFAVAATGYDTAYIEGLTCTVNAPRQVSEAFSGPDSRAGSADSIDDKVAVPMRGQALNWAWIVSNTSLIFPVILALFVIYMALQSLTNERAEMSKEMLQLQERQNEVIRFLTPQTSPQKTAIVPTTPVAPVPQK
jgi:hypothetical protein